MKLFVLAFCVWTSIFLSSCRESKLNKIEFVDSFDYVQKNMIEFDSLLTYSDAVCKARYSFGMEEDTVVVRDLRKGNNVKVDLDSVCQEGKAPVQRLKKLAKILKRNHINYVYKHYGTDVSVFGYYYSYNTSSHSLRDIVIDKRDNVGLLLNEHDLVTSKGKLVLLSVKGR
jgi:hypothetical protein